MAANAVDQLAHHFELLLRYGHDEDREHRYRGDGSALVGAIITHAINRGLPERVVKDMICDPRNAGGVAARKKPPRNLERWWRDEWRRALEWVEANPAVADRQAAVLRVQTLLDAIDTHDWPGKGGATERAVYEAGLRIAQHAGKLSDLALPVRQVGEWARVSRQAASDAMKRLDRRGLFTRQAKGNRQGAAARWRVEPRRSHTDSPTHRQTLRVDCPGDFASSPWNDCPGDFASDLWRWSALGHTALGHSKRRVYEALTCEARPASEIAQAFGVTPRAVQQHLRVLAEHGLAERTDTGWRRGPARPADVADKMGVAGAGVAQRAQHDLERQHHERYLAEAAKAGRNPQAGSDGIERDEAAS